MPRSSAAGYFTFQYRKLEINRTVPFTLRKNSGSFKERATILVRVMVLAVASDATAVPEVFPNARDANDPDGRDTQVPIHAHEGCVLQVSCIQGIRGDEVCDC